MRDTVASTDMLSEDIRTFCATTHKGPVYLAEAEFGLHQIRPFLDALDPGARVLEVGSGPCIALSVLAAHYPELHFEGIEPMGSGFALFEAFISELEAGHGSFDLFKGGYEAFPRTGDWDLIFLVNVFEHLPDWRHFLGFVRENLSPSGKCIVLCPNYGFPYESHFGLPVLWNKALTRSVFRSSIETFERAHGWDGLYDSLNFVKLRHVRREAVRAELTLDVHAEIVQQMIDRLETDAEFAKRQKSIAGLALMMKRSGVLNWLIARPTIQNHLPYMKLEFRRSG
ncbi:MAG: methyltransferase domain-containing protein [Anderseniella sp.]|jgi:SAM-dependent methyltransferase|nr:methyltransferase domain-containing protein [Anderseniella sp.]